MARAYEDSAAALNQKARKFLIIPKEKPLVASFGTAHVIYCTREPGVWDRESTCLKMGESLDTK